MPTCDRPTKFVVFLCIMPVFALSLFVWFLQLGQALSIRPDVIGPAATDELGEKKYL